MFVLWQIHCRGALRAPLPLVKLFSQITLQHFPQRVKYTSKPLSLITLFYHFRAYKNPKPLFLRIFMNLGVGWGATLVRGFPALREVAFEERNPTTKNLGIVGFHFVQPNLHLFFYSQSDIRGIRRGVIKHSFIGVRLIRTSLGSETLYYLLL